MKSIIVLSLVFLSGCSSAVKRGGFFTENFVALSAHHNIEMLAQDLNRELPCRKTKTRDVEVQLRESRLGCQEQATMACDVLNTWPGWSAAVVRLDGTNFRHYACFFLDPDKKKGHIDNGAFIPVPGILNEWRNYTLRVYPWVYSAVFIDRDGDVDSWVLR